MSGDRVENGHAGDPPKSFGSLFDEAYAELSNVVSKIAQPVPKPAELRAAASMNYPDGSNTSFIFNQDGNVQLYKSRDGKIWMREGDNNKYFAVDPVSGKFHEQEMDLTVSHDGRFTIKTPDGIQRETDAAGKTSADYPWVHTGDMKRLLDKNWDRLDRDKDGILSKKEIDQAVTDNSFTGEDAALVYALKKNMKDIAGMDPDMGFWRKSFDLGLTKQDIVQFDKVQQDLAQQAEHNQKVKTFMEKNFDSMDTDHDGKLSFKDLSEAYNSDKFSKEEREYLKEYALNSPSFHSWPPKLSITKDELADYGDKPYDSDEGRVVKKVDSVLMNHKFDLQRSSQELYAADKGAGAITPDAINQGSIGDCYLLAPMGSVAQEDPQRIKNMIKDNKDGTYTVTFPGDPTNPVTVNAPTEAELMLYTHGNAYGTWPAVLEKAYGKWKGGTTVPAEAADGGDYIEKGVQLLGGVSGYHRSMDDLTQAELDGALTESFRLKIPVVLQTPSGDRKDNLPGGHAYSVLGYDPKTETVTIRNPWGDTEPVDKDGKALDGKNDGVFKMSLDDVKKHFNYISNPYLVEYLRLYLRDRLALDK